MNANTSFFKKLIIAVIVGFFIGILSGLIGVGGGEFRLPILIGIFDLPIYFATTTNLIIGILISLTSFFRRISLMTNNAYYIALLMGGASIIGGYLGAYITKIIRERVVGYILITFLFLVGLKLIFSSCVDLNFPIYVLNNNIKLILIVVSGFLIGVISGIFGVAGGEFRIPILMFIFSVPIKLAGTISSLVALFAQTGGLWKHHQLKHVSKNGVVIAISMGVTSIIGSYFGATLVFITNEKILEFTLGAALILATFGMYHKLKFKQ